MIFQKCCSQLETKRTALLYAGIVLFVPKQSQNSKEPPQEKKNNNPYYLPPGRLWQEVNQEDWGKYGDSEIQVEMPPLRHAQQRKQPGHDDAHRVGDAKQNPHWDHVLLWDQLNTHGEGYVVQRRIACKWEQV